MTIDREQSQGKSPEDKIVRMPEREIILRKLQDIGLLGVSGQTNIFYQTLAERLSDREIVGVGLNLTWELVGHDTLGDYPPLVRAAVGLNFNNVIDAITPDSEVAAAAKDFRKQMLDEMRAQIEAEKQPPVEDPSSNFDLYVAGHRIADIVFESAKIISPNRRDLWVDDTRKEEVNPFYNQTQSGLFLEFYYGSPSDLWTPWGKWSFTGGGMHIGDAQQKLVEAVLGKLDTTLHQPKISNRMGVIGPIYAVHGVEGIQLPEPIVRSHNAYLPYEDAKKAWETFTKQYNQLRTR